METVRNIDELLSNCSLLDSYLCADDIKTEYAKDLIKKGICFVVTKNGETYKFYPSRFVGYSNNSMVQHMENSGKDGRVTNPAITSVLGGVKPSPDRFLDEEYCRYCNSLGFTAQKSGQFGITRKYWTPLDTNRF